MSARAQITIETSAAPARSRDEVFSLWAETYDQEINPLLQLEHRFLGGLLPDVCNARVLDVGCGTGRWLRVLANMKPSSLVGVDSSPRMLERAAANLGSSASYVCGNAESLPLPDSSFEVALASFVISYIDDVAMFAAEMRRVLAPGGRILISDVHPTTARICNWKRAIHTPQGPVELQTHSRTVAEIVSHFEAAGFETICRIEPVFGPEEACLLEKAGKQTVYSETANRPPIYVLGFQARPRSARRCSIPATSDIVLHGAHVSIGGSESVDCDLQVGAGKVRAIGCARFTKNNWLSMDLSGYLLLPGLVNAHDHLEFALFPRLGRRLYSDYMDWAREIHEDYRAEIEAHRRVPKDVRLWWGAIRNLLCGVTTVCHHNPLTPEMLGEDFPVRVVPRFGWAHSLGIDSDVASKLHSTPPDVPFILHAGEGTSDASAREIDRLEQLNLLDDRSIVVHALAMGKQRADLLNERGTAVVWCPSSNYFLFGTSHTVDTLAALHRVVLGSDSPLTACGDFLDEIRFAHAYIGVSAREIYEQVTHRAGRVLRLHSGEGTLALGSCADIIAVRDRCLDPAKRLSELSYKDVELVMIRGRVQLASDALTSRLPGELTAGLRPLQIEDTIRWIRAPLGRLFGQAENILGCGLRLGGKRIGYPLAEWL